MASPIRHQLELATLRSISATLGPLPLALRLRIGRALGSLAYHGYPKRARLSVSNIVAGLEVDRIEGRRIARGAYRQLGRIVVEVLRIPEYWDKYQHLFESQGFEHFETAHRLGRGVILLTAHLGNWELLGVQHALRGYPLYGVAKPLRNRALDRWLTALRERGGSQVLGHKGVLRQAMRQLQQGGTIFIMPDQHARSSPRLFIDFLGRRAAWTPFLAKLALKLEVPVVPAYSLPRPDGGYTIHYQSTVPHPERGSDAERVLELTRRVALVIEDWVRRYPEYWLWQHDRWKKDTTAAEREAQNRRASDGASERLGTPSDSSHLTPRAM